MCSVPVMVGPLGILNTMCSVPVLAQGSNIQSNLNSSNTDGSFSMANSNSFLSPYGILPMAQVNKCLGFFIIYHKIIYCVIASS